MQIQLLHIEVDFGKLFAWNYNIYYKRQIHFTWIILSSQMLGFTVVL